MIIFRVSKRRLSKNLTLFRMIFKHFFRDLRRQTNGLAISAMC